MSPKNYNQKYSKPPIKEAIFDLQTRNEEILKKQLVDNFLVQFTGYSLNEPLRNINIDAENMTQTTEIIGYRCISKDRKRIVQFKKNGFSFSRLAVYDGWDKSYNEALTLWRNYCEVMKPVAITRVATRFINQFKISRIFSKPEEYFSTYIHYDQSISPAWNQIFCRLLLSHNNGIKSHIMIDGNVNQNTQNVSVLLDIDVFSDNLGLLHTDDSTLKNIFSQLRQIKNEIFEKSITDKIRVLIK